MAKTRRFLPRHTRDEMTDRDAILSAMRHGRTETMQPTGHARAYLADAEASWDLFSERLAELGGHVITLSEKPYGASLLRMLDDLGLPARTACLDEDASEMLQLEPTADAWSADVGISLAELAVAETGSILIEAGPGRERLTSLAPPVHVAIVQGDALVASLEEALARDLSRTTVLITGPSRTADIEGVLVRGVHGPKDIVIARIPASSAL